MDALTYGNDPSYRDKQADSPPPFHIVLLSDSAWRTLVEHGVCCVAIRMDSEGRPMLAEAGMDV